MRLGERLKQLREDRNLTQEQAAKKVGAKFRTWQSWEHGVSIPRQSKIEKICEFFDISESELRGFTPNTENLNAPIQKIPVISWVQAGQFTSISDPFLPGDADDYIHTITRGENMFALKVRNDSMTPEFNEGDIIIVKPGVEIRNNDFVIIKDVGSQEATFKQYKVYGRKIVLHPLNPKYDDIELDEKKKYVVVGKVLEKTKRY